MDILEGMSVLLALLVVVFLVMCGYASTVDRIALALHRHAEYIRRLHGAYDHQLRASWQAEWRRRPAPVSKAPVPIQRARRRDHQREVVVGGRG